MVNYLESTPPGELPKQATFEEAVSYLHGLKVLEDDDKQRNWMLRYFEKSPDAIRKVSDKLRRNGLERFDIIGMGARSIVLDAGYDQVVRVMLDKSVSDAARSWKHAAILQPIKTMPVMDKRLLRIEVIPKVDFRDVTRDDEYKLQDVLSASGIHCDDIIGGNNVGIIHVNGKRLPILVDSAQLETSSKNHDIDKNLILEWLAEDKKPLQKVYDPRIGTGKITPQRPMPKKRTPSETPSFEGTMVTRLLSEGEVPASFTTHSM